jgi:hypothetical protein
MVKKTYNNVLKAARLIRKKGYDEQISYKLALQCFDNMEYGNNIFPVEYYINRILPREQWEKEYNINT